MDYIIVIPSYKRADTLNKKTLLLLKKNNIDMKKIYIFVANENEEKIYKSKINIDDYNKIIIGKETLKHQRNFISNYFSLNQKIINCDDDLMYWIADFKDNDKKIDITLDEVFKKGFDELQKNKCNLFGFYPVCNKYFMKNELTTHLNYIIGSCYGEINKRQYVMCDDKEDVERTIKYFNLDNKVLRFNCISFKTKYYTEKGGLQETRTLDSIKQGAEYIKNNYPYCVKRIVEKKNGRTEVILNSKFDTEEYKITTYGLFYDDLYNQVLNQLKKTSIRMVEIPSPHRRGRNKRLLGEDYIKDLNNIPRSTSFGYGHTRTYGFRPYKNNSTNPELYKLLIEYGKQILPDDFKFSVITLNKNLKCKRHIDGANVGLSCLTTLGDFTDGGLYVQDCLYNTKNKVIKFNGGLLPHETQSFEGDRYTLIFYNQDCDTPEEYIYNGTLPQYMIR